MIMQAFIKNNTETLSKNNYLRIQFKGSTANERGNGAKVKLFCKGQQVLPGTISCAGFSVFLRSGIEFWYWQKQFNRFRIGNLA